MKVYFDTNCIIYLLERNPTWEALVVFRIAALRAVGDELAVGDLSCAECLVGPFKSGDTGLEARYRAFFADPDVICLPITVAILERAARLRATHHSIKLPDAIHLTTAIEHGCGAFVTGDGRLAACPEIAVEVLT
jgi:predicted nucleic acid-binding protein